MPGLLLPKVIEEDKIMPGWFFVECDTCELVVMGTDEADAIAEWNKLEG